MNKHSLWKKAQTSEETPPVEFCICHLPASRLWEIPSHSLSLLLLTCDDNLEGQVEALEWMTNRGYSAWSLSEFGDSRILLPTFLGRSDFGKVPVPMSVLPYDTESLKGLILHSGLWASDNVQALTWPCWDQSWLVLQVRLPRNSIPFLSLDLLFPNDRKSCPLSHPTTGKNHWKQLPYEKVEKSSSGGHQSTFRHIRKEACFQLARSLARGH